MRSTSAAPSGLFMIWFTIFTISAVLPWAADWTARCSPAPRSPKCEGCPLSKDCAAFKAAAKLKK